MKKLKFGTLFATNTSELTYMNNELLLKRMAVLILMVSAAILGCRKENSANRTTTTYDFSYSGTRCVGDTTRFASTAPTGSTYLWDFGDSTTSTAATPFHIYGRSDTFAVSLTIDGDTARTIRKTVAIRIGSAYTHLIAGMRTWHHSSHHSNWGGRDTTFVYPDTIFSVNYVDPATVVFGADTLLYMHSSSSDTALYFYFRPMCGCDNHSSLFFYPVSNRIKYAYSARGLGNDFYEDTYTSGY